MAAQSSKRVDIDLSDEFLEEFAENVISHNKKVFDKLADL